MRIESGHVSARHSMKKDSSPVKEGQGGFSDTLKDISGEKAFSADLDYSGFDDFKKMADLISEFGESLSRDPTPENFNTYKKHIKSFISALMENLEVRDTVSRVTFNKQKIYKTVESVDEKLSELARMILSNEKNRLSYLKLVSGIKGLIIDLIM
ncbi:MAG: YaaR family protein [Brevinematales bacterium]|jgi:uncharacterized protein YaaR (DUF327 family)